MLDLEGVQRYLPTNFTVRIASCSALKIKGKERQVIDGHD